MKPLRENILARKREQRLSRLNRKPVVKSAFKDTKHKSLVRSNAISKRKPIKKVLSKSLQVSDEMRNFLNKFAKALGLPVSCLSFGVSVDTYCVTIDSDDKSFTYGDVFTALEETLDLGQLNAYKNPNRYLYKVDFMCLMDYIDEGKGGDFIYNCDVTGPYITALCINSNLDLHVVEETDEEDGYKSFLVKDKNSDLSFWVDANVEGDEIISWDYNMYIFDKEDEDDVVLHTIMYELPYFREAVDYAIYAG